MKKYVVILLVCTILFNIIGNLTVFLKIQHSIRKDVKRLIIADTGNELLKDLYLPSTKENQIKMGVQWIHETEFRYGGKMYDVASFSFLGNTIKYRVFNDNNEEQLIDKYLSNSQNSDVANNNPKVKLFKIFTFDGFTNYINHLLIINYYNLSFKVFAYVLALGYKNTLNKPPNFLI